MKNKPLHTKDAVDRLSVTRNERGREILIIEDCVDVTIPELEQHKKWQRGIYCISQ